MIMLVHVPLSELANMRVAFEEIGMEACPYDITEGEIQYFVRPKLGDAEEHLATFVKGTPVRITWHDADGKKEVYREMFGQEAFDETETLTPESVEVRKD